MRQWEIQLAESLEKHKHNQFFCELLETATRSIQSKIDEKDISNFKSNDWETIIEDCYNEIICESNDNK